MVGAQRPGEGALWALGATTAPPSAPFVRSQNQKPVCQTAQALRTTQLSTHEGSSGPHIPGFPCFIKGARCSLCALGVSSLHLHPSAKGRVKGDNWGQSWLTAREVLARAWPPPALSRDSFARFAVPEGFLGFEMSNISALLSKEYKVCNHRMFLKVSREINYTYAYTLHTYIPFAYDHLSHMSTHT